MFEDCFLFVDQHEFAVPADHPCDRIGQRFRRSNFPVFNDFNRTSPVAFDNEARQKTLEMLLLARTGEENGSGVEIFRVTRIENVLFRTSGRMIVEVGAGADLNGRSLEGWSTLRVEVPKKFRVGPRLIARVRTARERRSVAGSRKNPILVGRRSLGPLFQFDHDQVGT